MWLTRAFLRRPTLVFVFIALTLIAAVMALGQLVIQEQPDSGLPGITVSASLAGASTTELQTEIALPLENALAGTPYLVSQNTTIQSGAVSVSMQFAIDSTDTENIANVQKAVQSASRQLPAAVNAPSIRVANPDEPVVVTLALVSNRMTQEEIGALANNSIVPAMEQLSGVSNVNVSGTTQPTFSVTVDPDLLAANNLTVTDVVSSITPNNVRAPGGYVYGPARETEIDVRGDLPDPQSVGDLPIHVAYGGTTTARASGGAGSYAGMGGGAVARAGVPQIALNPTPQPAAVLAAEPRPLRSDVNYGTSGGNTAGSAASGGSGGGSGSGGTTSISNGGATINAPIDSPVAPSSLAAAGSSSAASTAAVGSATAQGGTNSFGSGSGVALSPFVGALETWAVPSADKRISDVATVDYGTVVPRISSSQNGHPGVTLNIQKQADASEVTVSNEVLKALPALERQFPQIKFQVAHVQSTFTEQQVEGVEHTLIEGIVLTAIVMLFFLGSWRNAVVVMVAIPTSLGVTLFVMDALGLTLDTVSLMAMTLVIGILIDDSTVVLENIERHHRELGESPEDAALNGRTEIGNAAIVITMVDVVVFLPLAFVSGSIGRQLHEFSIVIVVATLTSLLVSFTVTPTLAGLWSLKSTWKPWRPIRWFDERFNKLRSVYANKWLPGATARPWPILIGAAVLCVLAYLLVPTGLVGEDYIPAEDQGTIYVQVAFPAGHPLTETIGSMAKVERAVRKLITRHDMQYETTVSGAFQAPFGGMVQEGNVGQISIFLQPNRNTTTYDYVTKLVDQLPKVAPGAQISVAAATQQGGGNKQSIDELVGFGNGDPTPYAAKVFAALKNTPGATGVQSSVTNAAPQMEVDFNRPALQSLDVSIGTAAAAVEAAFGGDTASQIETSDRGLTDIEVMYPRSDQTTLDQVMAIPLRSQNGGIVHLGDVAYFKSVPAPLIITRQNRQQVVHITANVLPGYQLSNVTNAFQKNVKDLKLPKTVTLRVAAQGSQDLMGQALTALLSSLAISIVLVFLMIVALYNSYRTPFVTLFAIPVAVIGALGALWITRNTLNLYSLIGMVLLVGLVTKNGILLVDYADTVRDREGKTREEGIAEAATTRFRPIIMTTLAMVAGMLPLALGLEPGTATRTSLAIVVIGGLLSSLVLTLFIVPIMYRWIAPKELVQETKFSSDPPKHEPPTHGAPAPA